MKIASNRRESWKRKGKIGGWMGDEEHEFCAWHRLVIIRYKETGSREGGPPFMPTQGKRECGDNEKKAEEEKKYGKKYLG